MPTEVNTRGSRTNIEKVFDRGSRQHASNHERDSCRHSRTLFDPTVVGTLRERTRSATFTSTKNKRFSLPTEFIRTESNETNSSDDQSQPRSTKDDGFVERSRTQTLGSLFRTSLKDRHRKVSNRSTSVASGNESAVISAVNAETSLTESSVLSEFRERSLEFISEDIASNSSSIGFSAVSGGSGWARTWFVIVSNVLRNEFEDMSLALRALERLGAQAGEQHLRAFFNWFKGFCDLYCPHLDFIDYFLTPLIKRRANYQNGKLFKSEEMHVQLMLKVTKIRQLEKTIGNRQLYKIVRDLIRQANALVSLGMECLVQEEEHEIVLLDEYGVPEEDLVLLVREQIAQYQKETGRYPSRTMSLSKKSSFDPMNLTLKQSASVSTCHEYLNQFLLRRNAERRRFVLKSSFDDFE
uniref:Uncharacterized protein n=1 Tax=Timspurckia oligopyrenoides TaxID=708627 RepID=A0A7S1ERU9_9RHOD|mmetsp:Transcript_2521/g.4442  ORF Transcript_2521/g.4442 Transcript_2521/m.4442 type:complete len:411 (+) Transcript_2521:422-1654(+)